MANNGINRRELLQASFAASAPGKWLTELRGTGHDRDLPLSASENAKMLGGNAKALLQL